MTAETGRGAQASMIVSLKPTSIPQDEVDDWYDLEHIPQRLALPGFLGAERWTLIDGGPLSLTVYDLDSLEALASEPYRGITGDHLSPWTKRVFPRTERHRWEAVITLDRRKPGREEAQALLMIGMNVEDAAEEEFNRWYVEEHVPNLFALPGVLGARRYVARSGGQKHIAMYHLADAAVQGSPAWVKAIDTPWASTVRPRTRDRARFVCRRYQRTAG